MHSLRLRFIIIFALFVFASTVVMAIISSFSILKTGVALCEEQGVPVVEKAAALIDADEFERFCKNPSEDDPFYEETRLALLDLKETVQCKYLYTMEPVHGTVFRYIIDGSCDPSDEENFSPLGTEEDIESYGEEPFLVMKDGKVHSSGLKKLDEWGYSISTYNGIVDSRGKCVGFVGVDFDIDAILVMLKKRIGVTILVSLAFLCLGIVIVFLFTSKLFGTMKVISNAMGKIASGNADLTYRIPESGNNELTVLASQCNGVIASLNKLMIQLQDETGILTETGEELSSKMETHSGVLTASAEKVHKISEHISEQTEKVESITNGMQSVKTEIESLDKKLSEQSSTIEQSTRAIEGITENIKSVDDRVNEIIGEYKKLVEDAESGQKNQKNVTIQVDTIAQQSANLMEANASIALIAGQTNLLAMNAAIEAAHAGTAGKGFAVVAGEIRKLAETSAKQSESISKLLQEVTESINGIVDSSNVAASSFASVSEKINKLELLIKEVQTGMNEERAGATDIIRAMVTLEGTTKDINSASSHMKGESESVFEDIRSLKLIAEETSRQSGFVTDQMSEMKNSATVVVAASERSLSAVNKVSGMINGFSTGNV